jgi:hypothetical protein
MEHLFIDALNYLSFIGAVVIRRSIWLGRERVLYFGTEFVHVGVIFQKPLPGSALIIAEPFITIRFGYGQWTSRSFEIWMFKWPKLVWSFKDISSEAKRRVARTRRFPETYWSLKCFSTAINGLKFFLVYRLFSQENYFMSLYLCRIKGSESMAYFETIFGHKVI